MLTAVIALCVSIAGLSVLLGLKIFQLRSGRFYAFGISTLKYDRAMTEWGGKIRIALRSIHVRLILAQAMKWVAAQVLISVHRIYQMVAEIHERTRTHKTEKKASASFFLKHVLDHKHQYGKAMEKEQ